MTDRSQDATAGVRARLPDRPHAPLTASEVRFACRAVRRKRLFFALSIVGVVVGLGLAAFFTWQKATQPGHATGLRFVLVVMVLLAGRQQLRQYRYASILEKLDTRFRHAGEELQRTRKRREQTQEITEKHTT